MNGASARRLLVLAALSTACGIAKGSWSYQPIDGITKNVALALLGECTEYAPGYSDSTFQAVEVGMPEDRVLASLGQPLGRIWSYASPDKQHVPPPAVFLDPKGERVRDAWGFHEIVAGQSAEEAIGLRGEPESVSWVYVNGTGAGCEDHRVRAVDFRHGRVVEKRQYVNID